MNNVWFVSSGYLHSPCYIYNEAVVKGQRWVLLLFFFQITKGYLTCLWFCSFLFKCNFAVVQLIYNIVLISAV